MDFIVNYWSQITLIIGAIVAPLTYLGKRYFDVKDKKVQLKNSLFQNEKVVAITEFLSAYGELEVFYKTSVGPDIHRGHVNKHNFDMHFKSIMSKFQGLYNRLFIYLNSEELEPFRGLYDTQISVHFLVTEFFTRYNSDQNFILRDWLNKKNEKEKLARESAEKLLLEIGKKYLREYY